MKNGYVFVKSKKVVLLSVLTLASIYLVFSSVSVGYAITFDDGIPWGYLVVDGVEVDKQFDVLPGTTHTIQVCGLPCDVGKVGDYIEIKVSNEEWGRTVQIIGSEVKKCSTPFEWTCPEDATYCTTYVVQYRDDDGTPPHTVYVAKGQISQTGHIHVIPEFAFGPGMSILAMLTGSAILSISKKLNR